MAYTARSAQNPTRTGVTPTWITPDASNGDKIPWTPGLVLHLKNTNAAAAAGTVTVVTNAVPETGDVVTDKTYTLAAGAELLVSDLSPTYDVQTSGTDKGYVYITVGGAAVADLRYAIVAN